MKENAKKAALNEVGGNDGAGHDHLNVQHFSLSGIMSSKEGSHFFHVL